jgi:glycine/D-amino acid oxidase-like deaminating enzyme
VTSARQDERETCESCLPAETLGAVHVPGALSIDPPAYCRGLWSLCRSLGSAPTEASFMLVSNKSHTHV